MKEALFYELSDDYKIKCVLCPHYCQIDEGKTGICGVRRNNRSKLFSDIYGQVSSIAMDPIEKKPLYHFYPSSRILSIGTKGCNLKCPYCQNWHISQDINAGTRFYPPEEVIGLALSNGSVGIAYTYSEPVVWFEYVLDTARLAGEKGLKNVMVTNGYINPGPLNQLLPAIDAMNIDLKTYSADTYKRVQKGGLEAVKDTIRISHENGCHVEITTLIVTGINDNMDEILGIIDFISSVDKNIPWHISRYYPNYRHDKPATRVDFIMSAYEEAVKKLNYVYCGNLHSSNAGSDTHCPSCRSVLIERKGYSVKIKSINNGICSKCGFDTGIRH